MHVDLFQNSHDPRLKAVIIRSLWWSFIDLHVCWNSTSNAFHGLPVRTMRVTYRKVATSILLVISLISLKVVFYFNQRVGYGDANLNSVNNNGGRDRSSGPVDVAIDNLPLDLRRNQRSAKSYSESLKRNEIMVNNVTEDQKDAANTPQPSTATELRHVFISVKTSKRFHQTRVKLITETWGVLAREQVSTGLDKLKRLRNSLVVKLLMLYSLFVYDTINKEINGNEASDTNQSGLYNLIIHKDYKNIFK